MKTRDFGQRGFIILSAALLLLTAGAKLVSMTSTAHILDFPDPLLGISNRGVLAMVAVLELSAVICLLSRVPTEIKHLSVAWLGGNFLLYRLALAILKPGTTCKCLGTLTEKLHIDDRTAGFILTLVSLYLLIGGAWYFTNGRKFAAGALAREMPEVQTN